MPQVVRALRLRTTERVFSGQTLILSLHLFYFHTVLESQIQLGPGNRGDDPRFLLLGLYHHPDSGRLHRFPAGSQQVTRRAGRGLREVGTCTLRGAAEAVGRGDSPAGVQNSWTRSPSPLEPTLGAGTWCLLTE